MKNWKINTTKICILLLLLMVLNNCRNDLITENNPGIILSFDDYKPIAWKQHFDLFDKYNARVTFFVTGANVTQFMIYAQERGHEIGFHTITHPSLPSVSREQFFAETIYPINVFRAGGIYLTSFAYPFGHFQSWMHDELLQHYRIVRGFSGNFGPHSISSLNFGFIDSRGIDNILFRSEFAFRQGITRMIQLAARTGKIITLTSHCISSADWGITTERLKFVLRKANEYGLTFFRFKDLQ